MSLESSTINSRRKSRQQKKGPKKTKLHRPGRDVCPNDSRATADFSRAAPSPDPVCRIANAYKTMLTKSCCRHTRKQQASVRESQDRLRDQCGCKGSAHVSQEGDASRRSIRLGQGNTSLRGSLFQHDLAPRTANGGHTRFSICPAAQRRWKRLLVCLLCSDYPGKLAMQSKRTLLS